MQDGYANRYRQGNDHKNDYDEREYGTEVFPDIRHTKCPLVWCLTVLAILPVSAEHGERFIRCGMVSRIA